VLTVRVLRLMCGRAGVLTAIASTPRLVLQWDGVCRLLTTRLKAEGGYMTKLEVKKGSDASAGAATRRLITLTNQLRELRELLRCVHDADLGTAGGPLVDGDAAPRGAAASVPGAVRRAVRAGQLHI
jgi:hypothetical protein